MSDLTLDPGATVDFLVRGLNTPSPTGCYMEAMEYVLRTDPWSDVRTPFYFAD